MDPSNPDPSPAPAQPPIQTPAQPSVQAPAQPSIQTPVQPTVQAPAQPSIQTPAQPTAQPSAQPTAQPTAQPSVKKPLPKKTLYIILGTVAALLVAAAIAVGVVIATKSKSGPTPPETSNPPEQVEAKSNLSVPEQFGFTIIDDTEPGGSTTVSVDGNKVSVQEYDACSAVDCEGSTEEKTFEFSDETIASLYEFYETELLDLVVEGPDGSSEIYMMDLDSDQSRVIDALSLGETAFVVSLKDISHIR